MTPKRPPEPGRWQWTIARGADKDPSSTMGDEIAALTSAPPSTTGIENLAHFREQLRLVERLLH
jgi:hypothetical protein